jgi:hypothetical protein
MSVLVGSSMKTSSRSVVFWMAASIDGVGVVTTSPRIYQLLLCLVGELKGRGKSYYGSRKLLDPDLTRHSALHDVYS